MDLRELFLEEAPSVKPELRSRSATRLSPIKGGQQFSSDEHPTSGAAQGEERSAFGEQNEAEAGNEGEQLVEQVEAEEESTSMLERLSHVEVSRVSIGHTSEAQLTARDSLSLEGQLEVMSARSKGRVCANLQFSV